MQRSFGSGALKFLSSGSIGLLHHKFVFSRRIDVLSTWFARLAPPDVRILDVGCGDGLVSAALQSKRPDLSIRGIDVLPREIAHIPVEMFDGFHIPYDDSAFDVVLFSDVLHHTENPAVLLREAGRVASQGILIKDHYRKGFAAGVRLRFMDWVGNARFGVALPYIYWTEYQWKMSWEETGLRPQKLLTELGLYPTPVNWCFGAHLHFIALLAQAGHRPR
jgi:SAM-dependent methyltransferase